MARGSHDAIGLRDLELPRADTELDVRGDSQIYLRGAYGRTVRSRFNGRARVDILDTKATAKRNPHVQTDVRDNMKSHHPDLVVFTAGAVEALRLGGHETHANRKIS